MACCDAREHGRAISQHALDLFVEHIPEHIKKPRAILRFGNTIKEVTTHRDHGPHRTLYRHKDAVIGEVAGFNEPRKCPIQIMEAFCLGQHFGTKLAQVSGKPVPPVKDIRQVLPLQIRAGRLIKT